MMLSNRVRIGILAVVWCVPFVCTSLQAAATLHMGFGAGTPCATGCGGDPNTNDFVLSATFDIYQNSGGAPSAIQPVLLIIGVPNVNNPNYYTESSIASVTSYNPYPGTAVTGHTWSYGTHSFGMDGGGYQGYFTESDVKLQNVLSTLILSSSQNWTNWTAGLADNGVFASGPPSGFGIYVFALNAPLDAHGLIDVRFTDPEAVPHGSYLLAYAQDINGKSYSAPFTETGLQTPEPQAAALMGLVCLVLVGGVLRRKAAIRKTTAVPHPS